MAFTFDHVISQNITNFDSIGVYFKYKGELLVEQNEFRMTTYIQLEPYHKTIELVKNATMAFRVNCVKNGHNCENELSELNSSHDELVTRLNNIYFILLERPVQRRKRFIGLIAGVIGIGFGIGNSVKIKNLAKDVENMKNYMRENFEDIQRLIELQGKAQLELKKQNQHLQGVLDVHEKRIEKIEQRIESLQKTTDNLRQEIEYIKMKVDYQSIKLDALAILGTLRELEQWIIDLTKNSLHPQIFSPQNITDSMINHKLTSGKFLVSPYLNNYEYIKETIAGTAFIVKELRTIFVNLRIPIYQEKKLNLYEIIPMPIIKNRKILKITNIDAKYCAISNDLSEYDCVREQHTFTKGKQFYFSSDNTDISLLPTANSRLCIIDIFTQRSLEHCRYRAVKSNIEIVEEIDTNKFLFAVRDKTRLDYECDRELEDGTIVHTDNIDKNDYLQNTGIMYAGPNCRFNTEGMETVMKTDKKLINTWHQNDYYEFDLEDENNRIFKNFSRFPKRLDMEKMKINFADLKYVL